MSITCYKITNDEYQVLENRYLTIETWINTLIENIGKLIFITVLRPCNDQQD